MMSDLTDPHESGIECIFRMIRLAISPGALIFHMLKKAFPMTRLVGNISDNQLPGLAEVGMQFVCRKTFAAHIILWHFLPLAILATLGILIGRAALGWKLEQNFEDNGRDCKLTAKFENAFVTDITRR